MNEPRDIGVWIEDTSSVSPGPIQLSETASRLIGDRPMRMQHNRTALDAPGSYRGEPDVVGIFPNDDSITRLSGAVLLKQNEAYLLQCRYMHPEGMTAPAAPQIEGVTQLPASSRIAPPSSTVGVISQRRERTGSDADPGRTGDQILAPADRLIPEIVMAA